MARFFCQCMIFTAAENRNEEARRESFGARASLFFIQRSKQLSECRGIK